MAKKLIDVTVKMGRVIPVENLNRKWNENAIYYSLRIEDENGGNERYGLFTEYDMKKCPSVAHLLSTFTFMNSNIQRYAAPVDRLDAMKLGRIYKVVVYDKIAKIRKQANVVAIAIYNEATKTFKTKVIRLAASRLKRVEARYKRDPGDAAIVGWWQDLLD